MRSNQYYSDENVEKPQLVIAEQDPNKEIEIVLWNPHYSDERFKDPQTIFGVAQGDLEYKHSKLSAFVSGAEQEAAWEFAKKSNAPENSARFYSIFLSKYLKKTVEVKHIIAGIDRGTAFSYRVFGFIEIQNSSEEFES